MRNKQKLIAAAVLAAALIAVAVLAVRMIGPLLMGGVDRIQAAGEAPLPTEDVWVAPTPAPPEDFAAQEAEALENLPDPSTPPIPDEEEGSAPILETPEQLAGTADQSAIVDENPNDE